MALGAERRDVLRAVLAHGLRLALPGIGLGLVGAWAASRLLQSLLFGVTGTDPLTYVTSAALLVTVALGACLVPARRAARIDPMTALRYE
jgi:ABC-type antimicrobial peptide transport system permease subunit